MSLLLIIENLVDLWVLLARNCEHRFLARKCFQWVEIYNLNNRQLLRCFFPYIANFFLAPEPHHLLVALGNP